MFLSKYKIAIQFMFRFLIKHAVGYLSFPLAFGVDFHVGHFQSSYISFCFSSSFTNFSYFLPDDAKILLPNLREISTKEQKISRIKQIQTKRGMVLFENLAVSLIFAQAKLQLKMAQLFFENITRLNMNK